MNPHIATLTLTVTAQAALQPNRFVTAGGVTPAAGSYALGVTRTGAAVGDPTPVDADGTTIVEAGAPLARGDALQSDAQGRAIAHTAGPVLARALADALDEGDLIEVRFIPN